MITCGSSGKWKYERMPFGWSLIWWRYCRGYKTLPSPLLSNKIGILKGETKFLWFVLCVVTPHCNLLWKKPQPGPGHEIFFCRVKSEHLVTILLQFSYWVQILSELEVSFPCIHFLPKYLCVCIKVCEMIILQTLVGILNR